MQFRKEIAIPILLASAAFLVFSGVLRNGFTDWDDTFYVTDNIHIRSLTWDNLRELVRVDGPFGSYWTPAAMVSYTLDHAAWGLTPAGFHLTNLLLHALDTALLYHLIRRILRGREGYAATLPAVIAAGLFAIHPVQVETVAWISERKNVLAMAFFCGSFLAWLRATEGEFRAGAYAGFLLLFALSVTAKTHSVILPVLVFLYEWIERPGPAEDPDGGSRSPGFARRLILLLPAFAIALGGAWAITSLTAASDSKRVVPNLLSAIATAPTLVIQYVQDLLLPMNRAAIPAPPVYDVPWRPAAFVSLLLVVGWALAAIALRRSRPHVAFFSLWYLVALVPVLQFIPFPTLAADRFQYWAAPGLFTLAGLLAEQVWGGLSARGRRIAAPLAAVVAAMLCALTLVQVRVWKDSITLWTDAVRKVPDSSWARANLGSTLMRLGRDADAEVELRQAVALEPSDARPRSLLGFALLRQGRLGEARAALEEALRLDPDDTDTLNRLGVVELRLGSPARSEARFREVIRLEPANGEAGNYLSVILLQTGRIAEAETRLRGILNRDPGNTSARRSLALTLLATRKPAEAEVQLREVLRLDPGDAVARGNLGVVLLGLGKSGEAERELGEALRRAPNNPNARLNHGIALLRLGRPGEAEGELREALRMQPGSVPAMYELARIALLRGSNDEAYTLLVRLQEMGFRETDRLRADPEFKAFLAEDRVKALLARMEAWPQATSAP